MKTPFICALFALAVASTLTGVTAGSNKVDQDDTTFDFVVVGGGSSGCILGARLSESGDNTVLVLDSGADLLDTIFDVPSIYKDASPPPRDEFPRIADTGHSWEVNPDGTYGRSENFHVTRYALGGASMGNGGYIQRTSKTDLDRWAAKSGSPIWQFNQTVNDFKRVENWLNADPNNIHGHSGPVTIQTFEERKLPFHDLLVGSLSATLGVPPLADVNTGNVNGVGYAARSVASGPTPVSQGVRAGNTWRTYLKPVLARTNLVVKQKATVTSIEFKTSGNKPPAANKVHFVQYGESMVVKAKKEIIIAAGVYNSPKLLMLSGIGPAAHLAAMGIDLVVNSPNVGQNLQGNIGGFGLIYVNFYPAMMPFGLSIVSNYRSSPASLRSDLEISVGCLNADQTNGVSPYPVCPVTTIQNVVPVKGALTLQSRDPFDMPNITYNFFADPANTKPQLVNLFKKGRAAMAPFVASAVNPVGFMAEFTPGAAVPDDATDDQIYTYMKSVIKAEFHDIGTVPLGTNINNGVVDARLRVFGVTGLRVACNAIIPEPLEGHTAAYSALGIAEVAARLILEDNC